MTLLCMVVPSPLNIEKVIVQLAEATITLILLLYRYRDHIDMLSRMYTCMCIQ